MFRGNYSRYVWLFSLKAKLHTGYYCYTNQLTINTQVWGKTSVKIVLKE